MKKLFGFTCFVVGVLVMVHLSDDFKNASRLNDALTTAGE